MHYFFATVNRKYSSDPLYFLTLVTNLRKELAAERTPHQSCEDQTRA
jgi:hypothetical protein